MNSKTEFTTEYFSTFNFKEQVNTDEFFEIMVRLNKELKYVKKYPDLKNKCLDCNLNVTKFLEHITNHQEALMLMQFINENFVKSEYFQECSQSEFDKFLRAAYSNKTHTNLMKLYEVYEKRFSKEDFIKFFLKRFEEANFLKNMFFLKDDRLKKKINLRHQKVLDGNVRNNFVNLMRRLDGIVSEEEAKKRELIEKMCYYWQNKNRRLRKTKDKKIMRRIEE